MPQAALKIHPSGRRGTLLPARSTKKDQETVKLLVSALVVATIASAAPRLLGKMAGLSQDAPSADLRELLNRRRLARCPDPLLSRC